MEGWIEGLKDGQKDGHTLFYRTLLATIEGPEIVPYCHC